MSCPRPLEALGRWTLDISDSSEKETDRKGPNGTPRVLISVEDFVLQYDQSRIANRLDMWDKDVQRPSDERLQRYENEVDELGDTWGQQLHANVIRRGRSRQEPSRSRSRSRPASDAASSRQPATPAAVPAHASTHQPSPPTSARGEPPARVDRGASMSASKRSRTERSPSGDSSAESDGDVDSDESEAAPEPQPQAKKIKKGKNFVDVAATSFAKFQRKVTKLADNWSAGLSESRHIIKDALAEMEDSAGVSMLLHNLVFKGAICQSVFSDVGKPLYFPTLAEMQDHTEGQLAELTSRRFDVDSETHDQLKAGFGQWCSFATTTVTMATATTTTTTTTPKMTMTTTATTTMQAMTAPPTTMMMTPTATTPRRRR